MSRVLPAGRSGPSAPSGTMVPVALWRFTTRHTGSALATRCSVFPCRADWMPERLRSPDWFERLSRCGDRQRGGARPPPRPAGMRGAALVLDRDDDVSAVTDMTYRVVGDASEAVRSIRNRRGVPAGDPTLGARAGRRDDR